MNLSNDHDTKATSTLNMGFKAIQYYSMITHTRIATAVVVTHWQPNHIQQGKRWIR